MKRLQILFALALFASPAFTQQMAAYKEAGPVPPAITSAKTIFVSNAGSDSGLFPEPFTGDEDRAYTEFYAALKATGDYALVADPSQADLVLELRLAAPNGPSNPSKPNGAADPVPQFKLTVYERARLGLPCSLWIFTHGIESWPTCRRPTTRISMWLWLRFSGSFSRLRRKARPLAHRHPATAITSVPQRGPLKLLCLSG